MSMDMPHWEPEDKDEGKKKKLPEKLDTTDDFKEFLF
jgi:hypothetical protein